MKPQNAEAKDAEPAEPLLSSTENCMSAPLHAKELCAVQAQAALIHQGLASAAGTLHKPEQRQRRRIKTDYVHVSHLAPSLEVLEHLINLFQAASDKPFALAVDFDLCVHGGTITLHFGHFHQPLYRPSFLWTRTISPRHFGQMQCSTFSHFTSTSRLIFQHCLQTFS